jgi:hypothetical protein
MVKFKITASNTIKKVSIIRETEQCVFFKDKGGKEIMERKGATYYSTWEGAHRQLTKTADAALKVARSALARAETTSEAVKALKE